jgi:hypothetical protein
MADPINILSILPEKQCPEVLYHYTTQAGIIGILDGQSIWMTQLRFLNDEQEFHHAVTLLKEKIESRIETAPDEATRTTLKRMHKEFETGFWHSSVCVCSFCEDGDSLTQWRGYGGPTSGFSIGFFSEFWRRKDVGRKPGEESPEFLSYHLVACLYDDADKDMVLGKLIDIVVGESTPESLSSNFTSYVHMIAPTLKHRAFESEQEWRLMTNSIDFRQLKTRPGTSMLIPYYDFGIGPFERDNKPVPGIISKVVIGPCPHKEQSRLAVHYLLQRNRIPSKPPKIKMSTVPYRTW